MYKGGPGRTGEMPGPEIVGTPQILWAVALGGPAVCAPAVVDGVAYVASGDRRVLAIDVETGSPRWTYGSADPIRSAPAVAGGLVLVGDDAGRLTALHVDSGLVAWQAAGTISPESFPLVVEGVVYVGTPDGRVKGFDLASGNDVYTATGSGDIYHAVAGDEDTLYAPSRDGSLYAFDRATGERRWTFAAGGEGLTTPAVRDGLIHTVAHLADGTSDVLYSIDATSGKERWRFTGPAGDGLYSDSVNAEAVFVASTSGNLRAFRVADGSLIWKTHIGGGMRPAPAIVGQTVYVFGGDNELLGIDAVDGQPRWRVKIDGTAEFGTTAAGGRVFAVTGGGTAFAIGPPSLAVRSLPAPASVAPSGEPPIARLAFELTGAPDGLAVPTGLEGDAAGRIWVAEGDRHDFAIFERTGHFLERWGAHGSGTGQFDFDNANSGNNTGEIAFAPNGDIYVADTGNFRIQRFTKDRRYLGAWGGFGEGPGKFSIPFSVDVDEAGTVYVNDGNGSIQVFTPAGRWIRSVGESGSGPGQLLAAEVAVSDGRLFVADFDNNRIAVFSTAGKFIENWPDRVESPNSITTGDGRIYVAADPPGSDSPGISVFTPAGELVGVFQPDGSNPVFVAALGDGLVAASEWRSDPPGMHERSDVYRFEIP